MMVLDCLFEVIMADQETKELSVDHRQCFLCEKNDDNILELGEKFSTTASDGKEIVCHYFCILFSCNLIPKGKDDQGIKGYLAEDIVIERNRGRQLKCTYCNKRGPTIACCNKNCHVKYHLPCAISQPISSRPWLQFTEKSEFKTFCSDVNHRPAKAFVKANSYACSYGCGTALPPQFVVTRPYEVIQCPHCKYVSHRLCVQAYASTAGEKHFRCIKCSCSVLQEGLDDDAKKRNKLCHKKYVNYCRQYGIYVPKKDADWESKDFEFYDFSSQYQDNYDKCDAKTCLCKHEDGRKHDTQDISDWYISICKSCATSGMHKKCGDIPADQVKNWECETCKLVDARLRKAASVSGDSTAKSPRKRGIDDDQEGDSKRQRQD